MTPFKELQDLANQIRDKTGEYCSVSTEHLAYAGQSSHLRYTLYTPVHGHKYFKTVVETKLAMQNILNPPVDDGISLEDTNGD